MLSIFWALRIIFRGTTWRYVLSSGTKNISSTDSLLPGDLGRRSYSNLPQSLPHLYPYRDLPNFLYLSDAHGDLFFPLYENWVVD